MVREKHNFAGRLIVLIESHADELTRGTVEKLRASPHTRSYRNLPLEELSAKVYDVYHDLGLWLLEKTDSAIQSRYNELGERRFREGVPLREVLWAMVLTKQHLRNYIAAWALADSAVELYRQQELERLIGLFFDRAMVYTTEGYERLREGGKSSTEAGSSAEVVSSPVRHGGSHGWVL
jgi:hypothetical protein